MKVKLSTLVNFAIAFLLFILGTVIGYRYANTGTLPLGIKPPLVGRFVPVKQIDAFERLVGNLEPQQQSEIDFDVFWEAWQHLETNYLDSEKLDTEKMVDGAIAGLTSSLDDPYTVYLPATAKQRSGEDLAGSFYGVGIELGYKKSILAVVAPLDGTPADQAGVRAGDLIIHVKDEAKGLDEDTTGWSLMEAVEKIRGVKNSEIILTLYREGVDAPFEIPIRRGEIVVESAKVEFVEHAGKRVAHLQIKRFGERTMAEWDTAVEQILAQANAIDGIVLDMRNNPGGFFNTSIDVASDFVHKGVVVSQAGKYNTQDFHRRGRRSRLAAIPLVVLVNRGSASASEIVAGALRDNLDVKLVGEQTFGKGTVQDRKDLSNGGGMHITIGRWLMPNGEWIHDEGIPVDVEVEDDRETEEDEVLLKGIEELE